MNERSVNRRIDPIQDPIQDLTRGLEQPNGSEQGARVGGQRTLRHSPHLGRLALANVFSESDCDVRVTQCSEQTTEHRTRVLLG